MSIFNVYRFSLSLSAAFVVIVVCIGLVMATKPTGEVTTVKTPMRSPFGFPHDLFNDSSYNRRRRLRERWGPLYWEPPTEEKPDWSSVYSKDTKATTHRVWLRALQRVFYSSPRRAIGTTGEHCLEREFQNWRGPLQRAQTGQTVRQMKRKCLTCTNEWH